MIRRRRECLKCRRRYTTYEQIDDVILRVVKKDGTRVPFDRQKILSGLLKACEKRPVPVAALEELVAQVERELLEKFDREAPSKAIGELVIQKLRDLDQVAYVRFASVYREFKDLSQFLDELRPMLEKNPRETGERDPSRGR